MKLQPLSPKRLVSAMRMRGLEAPRGTPRGGGLCRHVAGGSMVEPKQPTGSHGSNRHPRGVVVLKWSRSA
jgi:hypothetical protein